MNYSQLSLKGACPLVGSKLITMMLFLLRSERIDLVLNMMSRLKLGWG